MENNFKKNSGKYTKTILLLALVFILGCVLTIFFYYNYYIVDYKILKTSFIIEYGAVAGFNIDPNAITFGTVSPAGGGQRSFHLLSETDVLVKIVASENVKNSLKFSENNFILQKNTSKQIFVDLVPEPGIVAGNYSGTIKIYMYRIL